MKLTATCCFFSRVITSVRYTNAPRPHNPFCTEVALQTQHATKYPYLRFPLSLNFANYSPRLAQWVRCEKESCLQREFHLFLVCLWKQGVGLVYFHEGVCVLGILLPASNEVRLNYRAAFTEA